MAGAAKTGSPPHSRAALYERDYHAWIFDQVRALRERRIEESDWANVAEEIEDLGKSERRAFGNQIARLYEHLPKLAYARGRMLKENRRGWELSVVRARGDIKDLLRDSPSLCGKIPELLDRAYSRGRIEALKGAGLADHAIPEECTWRFEQAMDDHFLPEAKGSE